MTWLCLSQVYAHKETCSEEVFVERLVHKGLQQVVLPIGSSNQKPLNPKLQLIWGSTLYHIDDLPFDANNLPDVYTQFRKVKLESPVFYKLSMFDIVLIEN